MGVSSFTSSVLLADYIESVMKDTIVFLIYFFIAYSYLKKDFCLIHCLSNGQCGNVWNKSLLRTFGNISDG